VPVLPPLIPLFPLPDVVLFPRMPMPLHIFEPRYRQMVTDVLEGHRVIGMTLLRPGWEADYQGRPPVYPVGCAGIIDECQRLEGGRYNLVLKGIARFRVVEERAGEPYRLASVEYHGDAMGDPASLESSRDRLLKALASLAEGAAVFLSRPDLSHELFANAVCQYMDLQPVEKQSLLDCESVALRYARLLEILEFRSLERTFLGGNTTPTIH
jgi:Lon protease-like protein